MRSRNFLFAGIFVLGAGILVALPYYARHREWLPGRWETLQAGSVEGITWERLDSNKSLRETGPPRLVSQHLSKPHTFVYRLPEGVREAEAFLVADGHELPLRPNVTFEDPALYGIQPVREYPPNLGALELVVRPKGQAASHFRVQDLPSTEYRFPVDGPEQAFQTIDGLSFQAAAWTAPPQKGCFPYVAAALRLGKDLPPGDWQWRDVALEFPFQSPEFRRGGGGSFSMNAKVKNPALGTLHSHAWARKMPRVRLSGRLSEFQTLKETIDFGDVTLGRVGESQTNDFGVLNLTKPIVAQTASGLRLRLEPVKFYNSFHQTPDAYLGLRMFVEDGTARTGFPTAQTSKGEIDIQVGFVDHSNTTGVRERTPDDSGGTATVHIPNATYKLGKLRLRLEVSRRVAVREIPFELYPNVTHRSSAPASTRTLGDGPGDNYGCAFNPSPEDFPVSRTAHN